MLDLYRTFSHDFPLAWGFKSYEVIWFGSRRNQDEISADPKRTPTLLTRFFTYQICFSTVINALQRVCGNLRWNIYSFARHQWLDPIRTTTLSSNWTASFSKVPMRRPCDETFLLMFFFTDKMSWAWGSSRLNEKFPIHCDMGFCWLIHLRRSFDHYPWRKGIFTTVSSILILMYRGPQLEIFEPGWNRSFRRPHRVFAHWGRCHCAGGKHQLSQLAFKSSRYSRFLRVLCDKNDC